MAAATKPKKDTSLSVRSLNKRHQKRPGVVAKSKTSRNKKSKNYKKIYKGQGK